MPTLSLLLDIPIPFGNLGTLIPEFFVHGHNISRLPMDSNTWLTLNGAYHLNAGQVYHYLVEYMALSNVFPDADLQRLKKLYDDTGELFYTATSMADHARVAEDYRRFLRDTLDMCRKLWATFNLPQMILGVAVLVVGTLLAALCALVTAAQASGPSAAQVTLVSPLAFADTEWLVSLSRYALAGLIVSCAALPLLGARFDAYLIAGAAAFFALVGLVVRVAVTSRWQNFQAESVLTPPAIVALVLCLLRGALAVFLLSRSLARFYTLAHMAMVQERANFPTALSKQTWTHCII